MPPTGFDQCQSIVTVSDPLMEIYELSPSILKAGIDAKWGCARCFYLKVKGGKGPPEPTGLGKLHHDIHFTFQ
jgi:hypothetical protein